MKISLKVQKSRARTPEEEYTYLWDRLSQLGNFVVWEVHPNVVKANDVTSKRLRKKLKELVDSGEYKYYTAYV